MKYGSNGYTGLLIGPSGRFDQAVPCALEHRVVQAIRGIGINRLHTPEICNPGMQLLSFVDYESAAIMGVDTNRLYAATFPIIIAATSRIHVVLVK